ncbi:hypothetical protein Agabi119p4_7065 [Agaricus bisporus var. burnettii]|uniref:Uncharacterized protein n=1 Tax=Agaricus bisporus var. burnettii TaxID=192524 RepID=A0A8H7KCE1_AGABI|nr:hypothetical protein Agabi119p4_7065 [Agaricus bisporus var. burnettii]
MHGEPFVRIACGKAMMRIGVTSVSHRVAVYDTLASLGHQNSHAFVLSQGSTGLAIKQVHNDVGTLCGHHLSNNLRSH